MQGHAHALKVTVQGHAHTPKVTVQGHAHTPKVTVQGHGARSRRNVTLQVTPQKSHCQHQGGVGHTGIRGPHIFSMGLESMGNNNNSGGSTMMIVLVVCACCCCVSSLIPVVAYFAYPPFKTWLNGLFGMNPVGGTWTCRANWQGISAGHTLGSPNPNGGIIKNAQTGGNITTNWGGQSDATWACNAWNSPCGNSPGKCSAFAA